MQKTRRNGVILLLGVAFSLVCSAFFWGGAAYSAWAGRRALWQDGTGARNPNYETVQLPSFARLSKSLDPAVVNVNVTQVVQMRRGAPGPRGRDPFFDFFFGNPGEEVPRQYKNRGLGTGFVINKEGYLVTNSHVVEGATTIQVTFLNGKTYTAKLVGRDEGTDVALLQIKPEHELTVIPLGDSDKTEIGDWVLAIGNPFGLSHTVTAGIVSAKGRKDINPSGRSGYFDFIQTDASINPGNSGGPLLNINGEAIGINAAVNTAGQGIGFAIPINLAKQVLQQLVDSGKVSRSWIGVSIQDLTPDLAQSFGGKVEHGALITEVVSGGPAEKSGLLAGDIVLEFDGKPIGTSGELRLLAANAGVNHKVKLKVLRAGDERRIDVKLGELPSEAALGGEDDPTSRGEATPTRLGLEVVELSREARRALNLPAEVAGMLVASVDGAAEEAQVLANDVVTLVNSLPTRNLKEFKRAESTLKSGSIVRLTLRRGPGTIFVAFKLPPQ